MIEPAGQQSAGPDKQESPGQTQENDALPPPAPEPDWGELLQQTADMGGDIARLLMLELRLALGSLKRMLILAIAALPVLLLAWVGLSALPGVLLYEHLGSPTLGVACFLLMQLLALSVIRIALARYSRALSLPLTRQQVSQFREGSGSGS